MSNHEIEIDELVYDRLHAYAVAHGTTPDAIVETLLGGADVQPVKADELAESAMALHAEAILERDESDACIRDLLGAFERELVGGYTTYAQQYALRRAKEVIASHGNAQPPQSTHAKAAEDE